MSTIISITEAVVTALNAGTFSQPFTAVRAYLPEYELPEMQTLHVTVVPKSLVSQALDRGRDSFDYSIDVAVQQKVDGNTALIDGLMTLVEEIADRFRSEGLPTYPDARSLSVKNEPVYSPEHMDQLRQFTSLLTLTYRVHR